MPQFLVELLGDGVEEIVRVLVHAFLDVLQSVNAACQVFGH